MAPWPVSSPRPPFIRWIWPRSAYKSRASVSTEPATGCTSNVRACGIVSATRSGRRASSVGTIVNIIIYVTVLISITIQLSDRSVQRHDAEHLEGRRHVGHKLLHLRQYCERGDTLAWRMMMTMTHDGATTTTDGYFVIRISLLSCIYILYICHVTYTIECTPICSVQYVEYADSITRIRNTEHTHNT